MTYYGYEILLYFVLGKRNTYDIGFNVLREDIITLVSLSNPTRTAQVFPMLLGCMDDCSTQAGSVRINFVKSEDLIQNGLERITIYPGNLVHSLKCCSKVQWNAIPKVCGTAKKKFLVFTKVYDALLERFSEGNNQLNVKSSVKADSHCCGESSCSSDESDSYSSEESCCSSDESGSTEESSYVSENLSVEMVKDNKNIDTTSLGGLRVEIRGKWESIEEAYNAIYAAGLTTTIGLNRCVEQECDQRLLFRTVTISKYLVRF
jgi:hypothetical protein